MTSNTNPREQLRSLFLVTIMVMSVFAMAAPLTGSAMAAVGNNDPGNTGVSFVGNYTDDTADDTFDAPRSTAFNQSIDVSIEVQNEDPNNETNVNVSYYVAGAGTSEENVDQGFIAEDVDTGQNATENITLAPGASETVSFTVNTGGDAFVNAGATSNSAQEVVHGFSTNPTVGQPLNVGTESDGKVTIDVIASDTLTGVAGINVSLYNATEFDTINNPNTPVIDQAVTNNDGRVQFTGLAVGADETNPQRYTAVVDSDEFTSGTTTTELFETEQTEDAGTITLDRLVNADGIEIDKTPASGTVELDGTITDNVTVTTNDNPQNDSEPLANTEVDITVVDDNTGEFNGVTTSNLTITPTPPANTDQNGTVEFTFELEGINPDEIDGQVDFTLEFEATESGDGPAVIQTQNITFIGEPPSGDGTISGDVEEIVIDGDSNTEPADGIGVHAVRTERVDPNAYLYDGEAAATSVEWETFSPKAFNQQSVPGEGNDYSEFFRVVSYENNTVGEVLDVRTDYLVSPSSEAYSQNLSIPGTGFTSTGINPVVAPLEPGEYAIQYSPDGSFNSPTTSPFSATENLTYEFTEQRYSNSPAVHTDVTRADGTYELYNLYTEGNSGLTYVTIAADDTPNLGFANFRGYSTLTVLENTDDTDNPFSTDQLENDLSVFPVDVDADTINAENLGQIPSAEDADAGYADDLDAKEPNNISRNNRSVDVIEVNTSAEGDLIGAEATVSIGSTSPGTFNGAFLNTSVGGDVVSHSSDEITIDTSPSTEGTAVVFLESDQSASDVFVQIEAALENGLDSDSVGRDVDPAEADFDTGKLFEGVTEYDSGSIKGDIARDDDALTDTFVWTREIEDASGNEITIEPHVSEIASTPNSTSFGDLLSDSDVESLNFTVAFDDSATTGVDESFNATGDELRNIDLADRIGPVDAPDVSNFNLLRFANPLSADNPGQYSMDRVPAQAGGVDYTLIEARQYDTGERGTTDARGGRSVTPGLTRNADITIPGAVVEANYELSNLDPAEATVTEGDDPINVSVDINNTGIDAGQQDIELEVTNASGDVVYQDTVADVMVDAQSNETVEFTGVPAGDLAPGEYNHSVSSDDDSIEGNLTVEESESPFTGPVEGNNPPADPNGDGLYEDVNGDGTVDFDDAVALAFADTSNLTQDQIDALDFDGDGDVDFDDAVELAFV